jgi:hypothetical protein
MEEGQVGTNSRCKELPMFGDLTFLVFFWRRGVVTRYCNAEGLAALEIGAEEGTRDV